MPVAGVERALAVRGGNEPWSLRITVTESVILAMYDPVLRRRSKYTHNTASCRESQSRKNAIQEIGERLKRPRRWARTGAIVRGGRCPMPDPCKLRVESAGARSSPGSCDRSCGAESRAYCCCASIRVCAESDSREPSGSLRLRQLYFWCSRARETSYHWKTSRSSHWC